METLESLASWLGRFCQNIAGWIGAGVGLMLAWWAGLPPMGQAMFVAQGADILTGLACALLGKSEKSQSGRVSSRAMFEGLMKKGAEWLVVLVVSVTGSAVGMQNAAVAAMSFVVCVELASLMENFTLLGLKVPLLQTILDVAQGKDKDDKPKE